MSWVDYFRSHPEAEELYQAFKARLVDEVQVHRRVDDTTYEIMNLDGNRTVTYDKR
jgi:hypothetical protein